MHTNGVGEFHQVTVTIGHQGIEIVNVAQAIATHLQRIGQSPNAIFSHIKGVLAVVAWAGITIRHGHFWQRCPVDDGAYPPLILVLDGVEHDSLAWCEPETEMPFLPVELLPADSKGRSFQRANPQWL